MYKQKQKQLMPPLFWPPIPSPIPAFPAGLPPPIVNDNDLFIDYDCGMIPGPPGPQGPQGPQGEPGPQGPPGTLANVPVTLIDTSTYEPTTDEYFLGVIVDSSCTITLPTGTLGKVFIIKDSVGDAGTNPITVTTTGSTIDGEASYTIDIDWGSIGLVYNGIEWNVT